MKVRWLMLVCLLMAASTMLSCAPTKAPETGVPKVPAGYERIRIVGATLGGKSTAAAVALSAVLNRHYPGIEWSACSGSSGTNPIFLTKGTHKIAYFVPGNYISAYSYDQIPESRLRSLCVPTPLDELVFLIPADKPWKDITEVPKGLTLCPGSPGSNVVTVCEALLQFVGLSKKDFNWVTMIRTEMADAWRAGKADFLFYTAGPPDPALIDISSARKIKAMGLTPEQAASAKAEKTFERFGATAPSISTLTKVAPGIFTDEVICPKQPGFIACRDDFPEEIAYEIARTIDEKHQELAQLYPSMRFAATPQYHIQWENPVAPIHPGVAKYYREKGYLK